MSRTAGAALIRTRQHIRNFQVRDELDLRLRNTSRISPSGASDIVHFRVCKIDTLMIRFVEFLVSLLCEIIYLGAVS